MNTLIFTSFLQIIPAWTFHLPVHYPSNHLARQLHSLRPHNNPRRQNVKALHMSREHLPSGQEIAQQKSETYQALSSFHETSVSGGRGSDDSSLFGGDEDDSDPNMAEYWECKDGAISYAVPFDPAAGLKKGIISKPYRSNVQIQMNIGRSSSGELQRSGIRLVENIQFESTDDKTTPMPFVRSIPLDANVDVDVADGSYSLDVSVPRGDSSLSGLPLLPPSIMGGLNPTHVKFMIEHTIAVSDHERCRFFLVYGDAEPDVLSEKEDLDDEDEDYDEEEEESITRHYRLLGVVLADESKKMPETPQAPSGLSDLLDKNDDPASPSPLDLLEVKPKETKDMSDKAKMDKLFKAINKHNEQVMSDSEKEKSNEPTMTRYSPTMFNICSGVYLGDTFIREPTSSSGDEFQSRGFGKLKSRNTRNNNEEDKFASWSMGVQKTTLQFQWDYSSKVIQSCEYGKCIGTMNSFKCNALYRSVGTVVVNEGRVTKSRAEKRVIWYMDGAYLAGLIGTSFFRAPRYLSFSESLLDASEPKLTEFIVFYKAENPSGNQPIDDVTTKDNYCSLSRRLYNLDGSLMQGSSGFFTMNQPTVDENES